MAVACEFIDVIVPIERIDAVYLGQKMTAPCSHPPYSSDAKPS